MSADPAPVVNVPRSVMEGKNASYHGSSSGPVSSQCSPIPQPALGFQRIIHGNGTSVGTVIALHCPDKHKLIGDSVKCVMDVNSTYWVGETYCKPLSYNEVYGFQLAVLISIVSSAIIFLMSMAFLTCCLVNCIEKSKRKEVDRHSEVPPRWEERQVRGQQMNRELYSNKSRNNNNNNFTEEVTRWIQHDPEQCDHFHSCRCQQSCYDPMCPPCSYPAARLPVLPGYEYNQPLAPQNPESLYTYSADLLQAHRDPDAMRQYGAKPSCSSGASNPSRNKNKGKDFSIRVISV